MYRRINNTEGGIMNDLIEALARARAAVERYKLEIEQLEKEIAATPRIWLISRITSYGQPRPTWRTQPLP
jgi:hypothetical protein